MFPTKSDVLCRFIFERELSKQRTKKSIAKQIFEELYQIIQKGIDIPRPTKKDFICENQIIKLYDDWWTAAKHQKQNMMTSKENAFVKDLTKMFDIIALDAEQQINLDRFRSDNDKIVDCEFLRDQRNERRYGMSTKDKKYEKRINEKIAREENLARRQLEQSLQAASPKQITQEPMALMPTRTRKENLEKKYYESGPEDETLGQFNWFGQRKPKELDQEYKQSPFLRELRNSKQKKEKVSIAKDPLTLQALDRTKTSSRDAFRILAPATAAMGLDVSIDRLKIGCFPESLIFHLDQCLSHCKWSKY